MDVTSPKRYKNKIYKMIL